MDTTTGPPALAARARADGTRALPGPVTPAGDAAGSDVEPAYLAGPPLIWRLLAANLFVVLGGAVIGTAMTRRFVLSGSFTPATFAVMVLIAIALSAILTALILHVAFRPLHALRQAIAQSGSLVAASGRPGSSSLITHHSSLLVTPPRVPLSRFEDPDIQAVARAVNGLWDRL